MLLGVVLPRRSALALALALAGGLLAGCQSQFGNLQLKIATGTTDGVYYPLGQKLAGIWEAQMGIPLPTVLKTDGSPKNIALLRSGSADIGFSDADAILDPEQGTRKLRALARIYDDYIQVVVRDNAGISKLADLAGHTVSVGPNDSQTQLVANLILGKAGTHGMRTVELNLNDSIAAMEAGQIDAFFWSGGLATTSVTALSQQMNIRLLDLEQDPSNVLHLMQAAFPVYNTAVVPAGTYGPQNKSVTTLTVPNYLLVTDKMQDNVAQALVSGLFSATDVLAAVNPHAALGIDIHTAIYTGQVKLHPGAIAYYQNSKI